MILHVESRLVPALLSASAHWRSFAPLDPGPLPTPLTRATVAALVAAIVTSFNATVVSAPAAVG
jgi:hypothetical protein